MSPTTFSALVTPPPRSRASWAARALTVPLVMAWLLLTIALAADFAWTDASYSTTPYGSTARTTYVTGGMTSAAIYTCTSTACTYSTSGTWLTLYYSSGCNTGAVATSFCSALSTMRALPSIINWLLLVSLAGCTLAIAAATGLVRRERSPIRVGGFSAKAAAQFDFRLAAAVSTSTTAATLLVLVIAWPVGVLTAVQKMVAHEKAAAPSSTSFSPVRPAPAAGYYVAAAAFVLVALAAVGSVFMWLNDADVTSSPSSPVAVKSALHARGTGTTMMPTTNVTTMPTAITIHGRGGVIQAGSTAGMDSAPILAFPGTRSPLAQVLASTNAAAAAAAASAHGSVGGAAVVAFAPTGVATVSTMAPAVQ